MSNDSPLDLAVFLCNIAEVGGLSSTGDGMRLRLEIPETMLHEGLKLWDMRGKVLKVAIRVHSLPPVDMEEIVTEEDPEDGLDLEWGPLM